MSSQDLLLRFRPPPPPYPTIPEGARIPLTLRFLYDGQVQNTTSTATVILSVNSPQFGHYIHVRTIFIWTRQHTIQAASITWNNQVYNVDPTILAAQ